MVAIAANFLKRNCLIVIRTDGCQQQKQLKFLTQSMTILAQEWWCLLRHWLSNFEEGEELKAMYKAVEHACSTHSIPTQSTFHILENCTWTCPYWKNFFVKHVLLYSTYCTNIYASDPCNLMISVEYNSSLHICYGDKRVSCSRE